MKKRFKSFLHTKKRSCSLDNSPHPLLRTNQEISLIRENRKNIKNSSNLSQHSKKRSLSVDNSSHAHLIQHSEKKSFSTTSSLPGQLTQFTASSLPDSLKEKNDMTNKSYWYSGEDMNSLGKRLERYGVDLDKEFKGRLTKDGIGTLPTDRVSSDGSIIKGLE